MPGRPERLASAWAGPRSEPTSCTAIPIFLLEPGDAVTFSAVDAKTFAEQDRAAEAGEIVAELIAVMSKLVISSIGPASSVQDGGRPAPQRYGLTPSGADGSARAGGGEYAWSETTLFAAAIEIGPFGAAFTARGGAVRVALAGASRNADIAGRAVAIDTSMTLADGETLTLGFARGGSFSYLAIEGGIAGRADVRQPGGECARRPRQPLSAPAAGGDELQAAPRERRGRAPDRSARRWRTRRSAW